MRSGSSRADSAGRSLAPDVDRLASWLDARFVIPGTSVRFGLDSLIGLIPGIGDSATAAVGCYIIARAADLGAPKRLLARMGWNLLVDLLIGTIPIAGDIFDLTWKANLRNAALLKAHLERGDGGPPDGASAASERNVGGGSAFT